MKARNIGALAIACALAPLYNAHADDQTIEEITVTAVPLGGTADQLVRPAQVVGGEELDRIRRQTIGDTLENQPGLSTTDFGAGAGRPVIRGQGGPRVQVLENGIPSMDASDVSTDHAVTIDPAYADQVEILKGSGHAAIRRRCFRRNRQRRRPAIANQSRRGAARRCRCSI